MLCETAETYKNLLMETFKNRDCTGDLSTLQIITPMKSGPLGTEQLNEALQKLLNEAWAQESLRRKLISHQGVRGHRARMQSISGKASWAPWITLV